MGKQNKTEGIGKYQEPAAGGGRGNSLPSSWSQTFCILSFSVMGIVRLVWFVNKTHTSVSGDSVPLRLPISSMHPWF